MVDDMEFVEGIDEFPFLFVRCESEGRSLKGNVRSSYREGKGSHISNFESNSYGGREAGLERGVRVEWALNPISLIRFGGQRVLGLLMSFQMGWPTELKPNPDLMKTIQLNQLILVWVIMESQG